MARSTRQEWAKRVERWQASGLTAAEFAAEAGINPRTLTYWKWKLGKERGGRGRRKRSAAPKVEFVEVASLAGAVPAPIELVVDGRYVVRVSSGADLELLDGTRCWGMPDQYSHRLPCSPKSFSPRLLKKDVLTV